MSYDAKCEELARHFLPSETSRELVEALAQRIQDHVEDEILALRNEHLELDDMQEEQDLRRFSN